MPTQAEAGFVPGADAGTLGSMVSVGYHASHEQMPPSALLANVVHAEDAGFSTAMCSDHLTPWSERQGHSGNPWVWLGAALQATRTVPFGVVTAPGQRYHPVIAAQAMATVSEMFPGRFWAALGSGENLNEHVTGDPWPDKATRNQRLLETVDVIRALWRGEEVTHKGLITVDRARLWSLPEDPPALLGAAVSEETARLVATWADGLITVDRPIEELRPLIEGFRESGGEHKRVVVQAKVSWAPTEAEALAVAHDQWRSNTLPSDLAWDLATPEEFDARTADVTPEEVRKQVCVSADLGVHLDWLQQIAALGVDEIFVHHVGRAEHQKPFIDAFASDVLPELA
ncbi:MAG: Similar to F420-dependent glucose-6-phosphate dehydrogenase, Mext_1273 family [uncultured Acidimicrobiales bacterium]|uniref:Similar to F420-dependent glucose-6-phosphate dehydrogenase, Mext_1273 family n=1 Tax=uncultured Acidimicrobiales bacterium TaxID=310071 RepID=A0A6J4HVT3_9ACTN|nr:MAG: Similar to F420-dependent glucose-6-phosphate dehydrogenase, Mext_1273 family [uncultured Acidimicrobiales bacterium]